MRRWVATCAAFLLVSAVLHADLTMTQTITVEGAAAAMMGGANAPQITLRVKGTKARLETEAMGQSTVMLTDLATRQMIVLNAADKTARVLDPVSPVAAGTETPGMDISLKPTGQKRTIDAAACSEYTLAMSIDLGGVMKGNPQASPEALQMFQGVTMVMTGSSWIATSGPGVPEFAAFLKAAADANMLAAVTRAMGSNNGLDRITAASAATNGMPYLTEMTMNIEGTGQLVDMMKQMGPVKIINKVTSVSTDALADNLFRVPAGYTMVK